MKRSALSAAFLALTFIIPGCAYYPYGYYPDYYGYGSYYGYPYYVRSHVWYSPYRYYHYRSRHPHRIAAPHFDHGQMRDIMQHRREVAGRIHGIERGARGHVGAHPHRGGFEHRGRGAGSVPHRAPGGPGRGHGGARGGRR